jgi:hypothetical protein
MFIPHPDPDFRYDPDVRIIVKIKSLHCEKRRGPWENLELTPITGQLLQKKRAAMPPVSFFEQLELVGKQHDAV